MKTEKRKRYPYWAYPNERAWKKDVRKRWIKFRKALDDLKTGCVYFPTDFVQKLDIKDVDRIMKNWYKKA